MNKKRYTRQLSCIVLLLLAAVAGIALTSAKSSRRVRDGELKTSRYVYSGGVLGGKQHGYGVCRYKNGDVYYGHWNRGYKEGLGRLDFADGRMSFGVWKHGVLSPAKGARFKAGKRVYGIDVAKYQKKIDWDKLSLRADASGRVYAGRRKDKYLQPVLFAMVKSTEGATLQDPNFKRNFREAKSHGIIRGAYHFLSIQSDVDSQVRNFIDNTPLEIGDMPPVLDLEISKKTMERHHAKVCRMAREWLRKIENYYGVKPIIYTYENYYKRYMKGHGFDGYDFWIARYSAEPSARRWEIWQFTDRGRCTGINHDVDIDLFRGDYTALKNYVKTKGVRRTGSRR